MKKLLLAILIFLLLVGTGFTLVSKTAKTSLAEDQTAAKLRCTDLAFWADEPNNSPGVYHLLRGITTIHPKEKTVASINLRNNATNKTATNVKLTYTFSGTANIKFVDARTYCSWDSARKKLTCSIPNIEPGTARSSAGRIKLLANNASGSAVIVNAKVTSKEFPAHSCSQASLQVL